MPSLKNSGSAFVCVRTAGEFEGLGFYLPIQYDWVLGMDNDGVSIIMAIRRQEGKNA